MVAPLRVGTESIGFLNLASKHLHNFTEQDVVLFADFLQQCSVVVRNVFVIEQLHSRNNEFHLQTQLHTALFTAQTQQE
jgi:hypothetical protein